MPLEHHILHDGPNILLGIALDDAVLDVVTSEPQLQECLRLLESPHRGLVSCELGKFGDLQVSLNMHHDDRVSIFVDGPYFTAGRNQAFGMHPLKEELREMLILVTKELKGGGAV